MLTGTAADSLGGSAASALHGGVFLLLTLFLSLLFLLLIPFVRGLRIGRAPALALLTILALRVEGGSLLYEFAGSNWR